MNSDFKDLLQLLSDEEVEYLVVGGYAVIYHAQPRSTKDLDIWLKPSAENAKKIGNVFHKFGIPLIDITLDDFANEELQYAIGMPPSMIDFLTSIPGLDFDQCWKNRRPPPRPSRHRGTTADITEEVTRKYLIYLF